jgi:tyrosinase
MAGNTGTIVRRPAVPAPIRVRRSALSLPANDPIFIFYGRAIAQMKTRPLSKSTSWRYQAAIHEYVRAQDPLAVPDDLPLPSDATTFWGVCEHQGWFFLPWHRMYLHFFEQIVLHEVIQLGGPTDWALPYWNYSASDPAAKLLPPAFQQGSSTGLFVPRRDPNANAGQPFLATGPTDPTDIVNALNESQYEGTVPGGSAGFGGRRPLPPSFKSHSGGPGRGRLEQRPHDSMHGAINGNDFLPNGQLKPINQRGFMGDFTRAPLDPIFWIHHCNIDRLWEVWSHMPGHSNPTTSAWLNTSFDFRDAKEQAVKMTASQVLNTRDAPLSYVYDDISP